MAGDAGEVLKCGEGDRDNDNPATKTIRQAHPLVVREKWRACAKTVAFIDIFVGSVCIGFCAAFCTTLVVHALSLNDPCWGTKLDARYAPGLLAVLGIIVVAGVVGKCISFLSDLELLQAAFTAQDKFAVDKLTWFWRALTISGILVCPVIIAVFGATLVYIPMTIHFIGFLCAAVLVLSIDFFWKLFSFCVVCKFKQAFEMVELKVEGRKGDIMIAV